MKELMNEEDRKAWDKNPNATLKINGKSFRCECGCNVFGHVDYDKNRYSCNSCKATFTTS